MSTLSNTISQCSMRTGSTVPDFQQSCDEDLWSNFSTSENSSCLENTSRKFIDFASPQKQALLPPQKNAKLPAPHCRKMSAPTNSPSLVTETKFPSDILGEHTSPKFIDFASPQKQALFPPYQKPKLPPRYRKLSAPTNPPSIITETTLSSNILVENTSPKLLDCDSPQKLPQLPSRQKQTGPALHCRKMSVPTTSNPENATMIPPPLPNRKPENITKSLQQLPSGAVTNEFSDQYSSTPLRRAPPVPIFTSSPQLNPAPSSPILNNVYLEPTPPGPIQERAPNQKLSNPSVHHSTSESSSSSYRQPHCIIRRRNLIFISCLSLLISFASLTTLVLLVRKPFSYAWQTRTFRQGEFSACIKCVYLMQYTTDNNAELKSLYNENRDGEMFCCARRSEQISNLMKLILRQQDYEPKQQVEASPDIIPHAHKMLGFASVGTNAVPSGHSIMKVVPNNYNNFYNHTVRVSDYSLEIEVSGWYYVYSNIYYRTNCNKDINYKTFEHTVSLMSPLSPIKSGSLIGTEYTCCSDCKPHDHKSSFAGGVFELFQGDQIFASVTNIKVVNFDENPYLGVAMIGE